MSSLVHRQRDMPRRLYDPFMHLLDTACPSTMVPGDQEKIRSHRCLFPRAEPWPVAHVFFTSLIAGCCSYTIPSVDMTPNLRYVGTTANPEGDTASTSIPLCCSPGCLSPFRIGKQHPAGFSARSRQMQVCILARNIRPYGLQPPFMCSVNRAVTTFILTTTVREAGDAAARDWSLISSKLQL